MFSVITLDFDGFLNKKEKTNNYELLNIFYESWKLLLVELLLVSDTKFMPAWRIPSNTIIRVIVVDI